MTAQLWDKGCQPGQFQSADRCAALLPLGETRRQNTDFGCGYGRIAKQLKQLGYPEVLRVDPSAAMIKRGLSLYPDINLIQLPQLPLPFADETFDVVLSCAVLTCMPSEMAQKAAILELKRVLKPGGLFHLSEFCAPMAKRFTSGLGTPMCYHTPMQLQELLEDFIDLEDEVTACRTLAGDPAQCYRAFARKPQQALAQLR
ncbi:class I SAM-dependent methyltransferase [Shewanella algae]|uniref:class I SAM-dependent methyltransferase n=2 Tax=Shewanella algae TaxID=38313 RepID=UPI001AADDB79|nr:class I SAM-dependent methyltransferase [Shewanella algae]MBO2612232.1 class I SAM-dependent methyltransferase [Shewanella algae]